jgi:hypothetical protein
MIATLAFSVTTLISPAAPANASNAAQVVVGSSSLLQTPAQAEPTDLRSRRVPFAPPVRSPFAPPPRS